MHVWSELFTVIIYARCLVDIVHLSVSLILMLIPMHSFVCVCCAAFIPLIVYFSCNIAFNVFTMTVIKYGGSTLMFVIMTLRLPLVQMAFSLKFINNPPDQIQWPTIAGNESYHD
jgi:hypothetical protein